MLILKVSIVLILINIIKAQNIKEDVVQIDAKYPLASLPKFWNNTGLCPPDPRSELDKFFARDDEKINLALIGSLPNNGISQVRIHWLFDLLSYDSDKNLNFTHLDNLFKYLVDFELKPGFELMGYPQEFKNMPQVEKNISEDFWADLVEKVANRYISMFDPYRASTWRFELWNEPDLNSYNLLNFTLETYLDYVNGCANGLKRAFSGTKYAPILGGPAGLFKNNHPLCFGLMEQCNNGNCPLDFISFHKKGEGAAEDVLNGTLLLLDELQEKFPNVIYKLPIANDESDIITNWSKDYEWRGDVNYAAMIVKVIDDYFRIIHLERDLKLELISFDNGFLNYHPFYFEQRTLFARFQMNLTDPPHNQFIKKPVYSAMALLSLLGNDYLANHHNNSDLTVIPTRQSSRNQTIVSVIISYLDSANTSSLIITKLNIRNIVPQSRYVVYILNNIDTNPYDLWKKYNKPVYPSKELRKKLRNVEEPLRILNPTDISGDNLNVTLNLTSPSVALVHICSKPFDEVFFVQHVRIFNITRSEVLITWNDKFINTKCVKTFEIEFQATCSNSLEYKRINSEDTIFLSYHFAPDEGDDPTCEQTIGRYRIRVVDFWDRTGTYAEIIYP